MIDILRMISAKLLFAKIIILFIFSSSALAFSQINRNPDYNNLQAIKTFDFEITMVIQTKIMQELFHKILFNKTKKNIAECPHEKVCMYNNNAADRFYDKRQSSTEAQDAVKGLMRGINIGNTIGKSQMKEIGIHQYRNVHLMIIRLPGLPQYEYLSPGMLIHLKLRLTLLTAHG